MDQIHQTRRSGGGTQAEHRYIERGLQASTVCRDILSPPDLRSNEGDAQISSAQNESHSSVVFKMSLRVEPPQFYAIQPSIYKHRSTFCSADTSWAYQTLFDSSA